MGGDSDDLIRALAELGNVKGRALVAAATALRDASRPADPQTARAWSAFAALAAAVTQGGTSRRAPPEPAAGTLNGEPAEPEPVPVSAGRRQSRRLEEQEYVDYGGEG